MKEFVINDNNLNDEDIEMKVVRVKGLVFNSSGKILLVFNNNTYQFPGGHLDDGEELDECIKREILEEVGIELEVKNDPFLCIETYDDNYFGTSKKVLNTIYYYRFFSDDEPDMTKTHYDELELSSGFRICYSNYSDIETFLNEKIEANEMDVKIAREMLHVIKEYNKMYGGNI